MINTGLATPIFLLLLFFVNPNASADASPVSQDIAEAITAAIASKHNALLVNPDFSDQFEQLGKLYQANNNQLLWLTPTHPQSNIESALTLLTKSDADGLDPKDYDAEILREHYQLALTLPQNAVQELAKFDTALSLSLLRFINDLHYGRVKPKQLDYPSEFGNKQTLDAASLIKQSIDNQTLAQLPETAAPQLRQYRQLKQILAQFRQTPEQAKLVPLIFEKPLRPGEHHPQLAELRTRLIEEGTLFAQQDSSNAHPDDYYSESLQEGVKEFQRQNGLQADGIIGKETAASLNQSLDQKKLQIELAMERLRWLPRNLSGPLIIVNIPAYELWAFNTLEDSQPLNMKVIVGKALKNQTPVLFEEMKYLEFKPYWNIPRNIMNEEILPKLTNDWGYLQSQDIELVGNWESWDEVFDDIRQGRIRARQRPGKKNPLGKVKFIFPNKADVYLHDTSTPNLFNRSRRDLSHGCVRVEAAEKLAEFVLNNQPESNWDSTSIQEAMAGPSTRRVTLQKAIPVLFYYSTAFVDPNDKIHFYPDVYKQDPPLKKALGKLPIPESDSLLTSRSSKPG